MGFFQAIGLMLICFKVTEIITWPWIWVLFPLWIGYAISTVFMLIVWIIAIYVAIFGDKNEW